MINLATSKSSLPKYFPLSSSVQFLFSFLSQLLVSCTTVEQSGRLACKDFLHSYMPLRVFCTCHPGWCSADLSCGITFGAFRGKHQNVVNCKINSSPAFSSGGLPSSKAGAAGSILTPAAFRWALSSHFIFSAAASHCNCGQSFCFSWAATSPSQWFPINCWSCSWFIQIIITTTTTNTVEHFLSAKIEGQDRYSISQILPG